MDVLFSAPAASIWTCVLIGRSASLPTWLQVSALLSLRTLNLSDNPGLASGGPSTWQPLLALRLLQTLDLSQCGIDSPPAVLAPLQAAGVDLRIS